jgi:hypothetical protein
LALVPAHDGLLHEGKLTQTPRRLAGATILVLMNAAVDSILDEFNLLAIQYLALFAGPPTERTAWLRRVEIAIADLYAAGLRLPLTEPSDQDAPTMPLEDKKRLAIDIFERLGGDSIPYSIVFHPRDLDETPVVGTLVDDLGSIYEDLTEGTALLAAGGLAEDVIWAWYVNFQIHWGRHAVGALQALHDMLR